MEFLSLIYALSLCVSPSLFFVHQFACFAHLKSITFGPVNGYWWMCARENAEAIFGDTANVFNLCHIRFENYFPGLSLSSRAPMDQAVCGFARIYSYTLFRLGAVSILGMVSAGIRNRYSSTRRRSSILLHWRYVTKIVMKYCNIYLGIVLTILSIYIPSRYLFSPLNSSPFPPHENKYLILLTEINRSRLQHHTIGNLIRHFLYLTSSTPDHGYRLLR